MAGLRPVLFAALAGLLGALGHAPFGLWPVALAGFVLAIYLVSRAEKPGRVAWAAGAAYFGVALHWIVEPFLVDIETHGWMAPFALLFLASGLALFWAAAGWLSARMAGPRAIAFAVALTGAEVLRGHLFTGFPWALPAYIWVDTPLRFSVSLVGSYGLTFLTLLAASLPAVLPRLWPGAVGGGALLGLLAFPGLMPPAFPTESLGTVRILQPDIPQDDKWNPDFVQSQFQRKLELTRGDGTVPDLVVWPEAAVIWPLDVAAPALEAIAAASGAPAVVGLNRREGPDWFNSLAVVDSAGGVTATFDKVHLVPFGEYIPLRLAFVRGLAARDNNGYAAGSSVALLETPIGQAVPLICYEGIFPRHIFRAGARADYLLLLTNDAWFGTFAGPRQHFDQARFRAAEHGLSVVRVANKGISAVIDPFGGITPREMLMPGSDGSIDVPVPHGLAPTLYARTGDWPLFALIGLITAGAVGFRRRNRIAERASVG